MVVLYVYPAREWYVAASRFEWLVKRLRFSLQSKGVEKMGGGEGLK